MKLHFQTSFLVKEVKDMSECIFCKIAKKEIPAQIVYEDETILVFKDLSPVAPVHYLMIPKVHIQSIHHMNPEHIELVGSMLSKVNSIVSETGIAESGYRVVTNIGVEGGQTVDHLHFHIIGGRNMQWPPG